MKLVCQECKQTYKLEEELNHYKKSCAFFKKTKCLYCEDLLSEEDILVHTKDRHLNKLDDIIGRLYMRPEPVLRPERVLK